MVSFSRAIISPSHVVLLQGNRATRLARQGGNIGIPAVGVRRTEMAIGNVGAVEVTVDVGVESVV